MSAVTLRLRDGTRAVPPRAGAVLDERASRRNDLRILYGSLAISAVLGAVALFNAIGLLTTPLGPSEGGGWSPALDFLVIGVVVALLPYGAARGVHLRRVDAIEQRLPEFLEDVAESGSFGLTLAEAIEAAAQGHYGPLTPEIRRMSSQIAWGIPVTESLERFAERIPTPLVRQAVSITIRAEAAGGNYPDVLRRVARDTRAAQLARTRRKAAMGTYVMVVYLAFLVFLLTIYVLAALFLPQLLLASGASATFGFGGLVGASVVTSLFLALTVAVLLHGVGDGLVSGFLYRGRWVDGLPHAAALLLVGWIVMRFIVPPLGGGG